MRDERRQVAEEVALAVVDTARAEDEHFLTKDDFILVASIRLYLGPLPLAFAVGCGLGDGSGSHGVVVVHLDNFRPQEAPKARDQDLVVYAALQASVCAHRASERCLPPYRMVRIVRGLFAKGTLTIFPDPEHVRLMQLALDEARKSTADTSSRFRVGALLVDRSTSLVLSAGYTGELPGNTHAEECALQKLPDDADLTTADLYTTMQPCTLRLSGLRTCTDRVLAARLPRCFIGTYEPADFVASASVDALEAAGVEVVHVGSLGPACIAVARGVVTR